MRILQLCTKVPYPPKDGGAAGVYVFSKAFAMLGHSVDVLAVNPPKHFTDISQLADLPTNIQIYPVQLDTTPTWPKALKNLLLSRLPYQVERFVDKNFVNWLVEILNRSNPDIVQIEGVYLCPYIAVIRKCSKAKIILRAHNIEHVLWHDIARNEHSFLKHIYLNIQAIRMKKYEISQFAMVDAVTTVTENDLLTLRKYCPKVDVRVFPFGVEDKTAPYRKQSNLDAIAFLGALDWVPNQEAIRWFAGEVWPVVHKQFPALQFHIAGRNASLGLVSYLKNADGIFFHGEIPDAQLFINQFMVMVAPLFSGSGIRVKIIEAMQQGVVVIASAKAAEGIPAISGKHLLLAETATDYVNHLHHLMTHAALIENISANAKQLVNEKFNILAIASELTEFYNNLNNG
jgi:glycosyltransferase involved in cell wall biosynthesis